jgi:hydrogenase expression/formation protein HypE
MSRDSSVSLNTDSCTVPLSDHARIQLSHGGGGRLSAELIRDVILPYFDNDILKPLEDSATLCFDSGKLAFTTDSFVVDPIFFPGGNIGDLAVNGTVNDLLMSGATPRYLSVAFIIEEGFALNDLKTILQSMQNAAITAGIQIVCGDTKVVPRGGCDQLFVNTTGLGTIPPEITLSAAGLQTGDKIIISGTIGDHGMAVMTAREKLSFQSCIQSDCAALNALAQIALEKPSVVRAMRDPTRGGVISVLYEMANASRKGIILYEDALPVASDVNGACEILGIDPLQVANEGKMIVIAEPDSADDMVLGKKAAIIGEVTSEHSGLLMRTCVGSCRMVALPADEQLPRIC